MAHRETRRVPFYILSALAVMPGKQVREVYVEPVGDLKLLLGGKHGYMRVRGGQGDRRLSRLRENNLAWVVWVNAKGALLRQASPTAHP